MRVGYLRAENNEAEMQTAMASLEEVGCDRVVVESIPRHRSEAGAAFNALIDRMRSGDHLVVTGLDQLAGSTPKLLERLAKLMERGVTVRTLGGEFDTGEAETARTISALWDNERRVRKDRRLGDGEVPVGRAFRLGPDAVARARELIDGNGRPVAEVARTLRVSRATLYRALKRFSEAGAGGVAHP